MDDWQLEIRDTGKIAVQRLVIADRFWGRFCGLQFCRPLPPGQGLLLALGLDPYDVDAICDRRGDARSDGSDIGRPSGSPPLAAGLRSARHACRVGSNGGNSLPGTGDTLRFVLARADLPRQLHWPVSRS